MDTVPALNAILQTLQNLQVVTYVSGVVVGAIETGYVGVNIVNSAIQVPVQLQSSLITVPITGVVGGVVSIGNVPTVLVNTGYVGVSVLNTPSVLVNTGYVGVSVLNTPSAVIANTVNVTVVNTPSVNVANTPTVLVGSTVNVAVVNTPNVNVANTPTVTVGNTVNVTVVNTPNVNVANTPSVIINTGYVGASIVNTPTVNVGTTVNATIVGSTIQVPVQIQSSLINVPITGVVGVNTGVVANAGAYTVLDQVVYSNTTFYTASPPSTTYSTAINVVPYETVSVLFNVVSLLGTGVTVSLNAYFTGLGIAYSLASQTLTSAGQALLTASVLPFNYIELGVTIYGSTVVLSAELVAKP